MGLLDDILNSVITGGQMGAAAVNRAGQSVGQAVHDAWFPPAGTTLGGPIGTPAELLGLAGMTSAQTGAGWLDRVTGAPSPVSVPGLAAGAVGLKPGQEGWTHGVPDMTSEQIKALPDAPYVGKPEFEAWVEKQYGTPAHIAYELLSNEDFGNLLMEYNKAPHGWSVIKKSLGFPDVEGDVEGQKNATLAEAQEHLNNAKDMWPGGTYKIVPYKSTAATLPKSIQQIMAGLEATTTGKPQKGSSLYSTPTTSAPAASAPRYPKMTPEQFRQAVLSHVTKVLEGAKTPTEPPKDLGQVLINSRESLYHATDPWRFQQILDSGELRPGYTPGVSTSRIPVINTKRYPISLVIDPKKAPPSVPLAAPAFSKTTYDYMGNPVMSRDYEFENRTRNQPIPLEAVKGVVINRNDISRYAEDDLNYGQVPEHAPDMFKGFEEYGNNATPQIKSAYTNWKIQDLQRQAAIRGIPTKVVDNARDAATYRGKMAKAGLSPQVDPANYSRYLWALPLAAAVGATTQKDSSR